MFRTAAGGIALLCAAAFLLVTAATETTDASRFLLAGPALTRPNFAAVMQQPVASTPAYTPPTPVELPPARADVVMSMGESDQQGQRMPQTETRSPLWSLAAALASTP